MKTIKKCNFFTKLLNSIKHVYYITKNICNRANMPIVYNINNATPMGQGSPFGGDVPPGMGGDMMGGAMMTGKWTNRYTGKTINVRDSVMDGDNMIVITDEGTISMNEFSNNYIQASDEVYDTHGHVIGTQEVKPDELGAAYQLDGQNPLSDPTIYAGNSTAQVVTEAEIPNYKLIDKIFKKTDSKPTIKFDIEWANFPAAKLQMLVDCFDVSQDDISAYINKNFVDQQAIVESLNEFLKSSGVE